MRLILKILFASSFLLLTNSGSAQVYLKLDKNECSIFKDNVVNVKVVDKRADTNASVGKVVIDAIKGQEPLLFQGSFSQELSEFYQYHFDHSEQQNNQQLIILVYEFSAIENKPGPGNETASFTFSADYFLSGQNGTYSLIGSSDITKPLESYNVTPAMFKAIAQTLCRSCDAIVKQPWPIATGLSLQDILNYRKEAKKHIPLFQTTIVPDGAYNSWNDFLTLQKVKNVEVKKLNKTITFISKNEKGKNRYYYDQNYKVVVANGVAYYKALHKFRALEKRGNDYYTEAWLEKPAKSSDVAGQLVLSIIFSPMVGGLLVPSGSSSAHLYECKINDRTGELIPIKRVEQ